MRVVFELNVAGFRADECTWHKALIIGEDVPIAQVFDITRDLLFDGDDSDALILQLAQTLGDGRPVQIVWDTTAAHDLLIKSDATVSVNFDDQVVDVNGVAFSFNSIMDVYDTTDELRDEFIVRLQGETVDKGDKDFCSALATIIALVTDPVDSLCLVERIGRVCAVHCDSFDWSAWRKACEFSGKKG